jgi:hypothetical protein
VLSKPAGAGGSGRLLVLQKRGAEQGGITIYVFSGPFKLYPGADTMLPTRQEIGHRVFYKGLGGSIGVSFTDFYEIDVNGKAWMMIFGPDDGVNPSDETKLLEPEILRTFRTF